VVFDVCNVNISYVCDSSVLQKYLITCLCNLQPFSHVVSACASD